MSLFDFLMASPTMVVLLACSIITVGFAVERVMYFMTSAGDARRFMTEFGNRIKTGNARAVLDFCGKHNTPLARVMSQGVMNMNRSREELNQRLNTAIEMEMVEMERNLSVLGTMSNIAPLLGLFGTVVGIIRAFADIARTGSGGGSVVAMGVSEALMTTAAGIIVAVIATVFFNIFVRKIRTRTAQLEDAREAFFTMWSQMRKKTQRSPQSARQQSTQTVVEDRQPVTAGV